MRNLSYQIIFFLFTISIFAQSPHGDKFDIDCSECHNADSWKVDLPQITFDHSKTNFSLIGQHQNLDCKSCHNSLVFSKMDKECFSCHKDIHQATVGLDCANCHTPTTWIVKDIVGLHQKGRFPLLGAHKTADCAQCHSGYSQLNFEPLNIDCYACHEQNYKSTLNPNHVDANFSTDCQDCHNINALSWSTTNVNHSFFPLIGGHALPSCYSCHQQGGNFSGLSPDCYSCHQKTYEATQNPNHIMAGLPTTCNVCHNINGWAPASFNHDITQFPLTGKHINVDCSNCHITGYTGTPTDCYACHRQDYESVTDPNHVASQFPTDCSLCHTTAGWEGATFDHTQTQFPLTGSHQTVSCSQCHQNGYTGTPTDCYACHQGDYNNTTNPNHQTSGIPTTCAVCHSTTAWQPATFDHNLTQFPLTGSHQTVPCSQCHQNGYTGTPTDCYACHQTDYNNTTNPNHQSVSFPTTCADCHTTTAWQPATFDHDNQYFPIYSGKHNGKWNQCSECHTVPSNYGLFSCIDCHEHRQSEMDNKHQGVQGYVYNSADCFACHPDGSSEGAFNHVTSIFPLTGAHLTLDCAQCHQNGYPETPTECLACHQTNYNNTTNPNHQALSISTDCASCHSTNTDWKPAQFPQHNQYFELLGRHLEIINDCNSCHNSNYNSTPNQCVNCHQQNYNNAINPNHSGAGISIECASCHNSTGWSPSTFDHSSMGFTLLGAHQPLQCSSCHIGTTSGLTTDCISCHQSNYNSAANHTAQSYPTNCEMCHNSVVWNQVTFDHQNTNFLLTGAHQTVPCSQCHQNGYTGTPTDCYACHQTDYNNTTNPNHQSVSFPTTCADCHTTTAWQPATFDHDNQYFPIYSGKHDGEWNQCSECHTTPNNYGLFSCIDCHEHRQSEMDNKHQGVNGYVYNSINCYDCHPDGNSDAAFNHMTYGFPLTGAHHAVDCADCHKPDQERVSSECAACHLQDYLKSVNPNHKAMGISTDCVSCHNTNNWDSGLKTLDENKVF